MRGVAGKEDLHNTWSVVREDTASRELHGPFGPTQIWPAAGEGRSVLDPANAEFEESIRSGTCPRELDPLDPSKHVSPAVLVPTFSISYCSQQRAVKCCPPISQECRLNRCFDSGITQGRGN